MKTITCEKCGITIHCSGDGDNCKCSMCIAVEQFEDLNPETKETVEEVLTTLKTCSVT